MALIRRKRKTPSAINDVPLTPLIDTALTLLIIFMVTTPMMQNAIKVTLPEGKAKEDAGAKQDLIVYIDQQKKMFFNGLPVNNESLVSTVKRNVGSNKECTVFVKADKQVPYGYVIQVVDQLKVAGGVRYVALATQKAA
jgi:biopolymer transport protein TolR